MFDSIFQSVTTQSLNFESAIKVIICALIIGIIVSFTYIFTEKKDGIAKNFAVTLVLLPIIIASIIMVVGTNIASAFSLAGAFSLLRFRSVPGNPKDMTYVFVSVAAGLSSGMGFVGFSILVAILVCLIIILLSLTKYGEYHSKSRQLNIFLPENLNYKDAFEEIFNEFTTNHELTKIKTADLGSVYQLHYNVTLKKDVDEKDFIDKLRTRNGNLNIILSMKQDNTAGFNM